MLNFEIEISGALLLSLHVLHEVETCIDCRAAGRLAARSGQGEA